MTLRASSIVTAIVTAIVTVVPAKSTLADVVTVCGNLQQSLKSAGQLPAIPLAPPIVKLGGRSESDIDSLIALWQDERGFDLLINWGESSQHSLRAEGAEIIGTSPDPTLVHLMVAHDDGNLEHFLFDLDDKGSGELLRIAADGPSTDSLDDSTTAACAKPQPAH